MKLKLVFVLSISALFLGCFAATEDLKNIYKKQIEIENRVEQLSQDLQNLQELEKKREERIARIEKSLGESYARLYRRLNDLEKKNVFPEESPDSPPSSSPDALYSMAESYYTEGKFESAILEYQRFINTYPEDSRVPNSYLKQGLALVRLGRKEEAKFFFRTLIDKFPGSGEAKIAREKLRNI